MKRAVLIGLGMVAETHLRALRDASGVTLGAVLGRDARRTLAFARKAEEVLGHPVDVHDGLGSIAADPTIDFVILATPPDARMEAVTALAAAGKPVLMEKPLERDFAAAARIVALCEARGLPAGVVFQHRARAASLALKEAVAQGVLGEIVSAEIRVPWWRDQSYYDSPGRGARARDGGGVMITQAIHTLDLALWLIGPVVRLQAQMHRTALHRVECEDWAAALFETAAGCRGTLFATTAAFPGSAETLSLHGTRASAHLEAGVLRLRHRDGREETIGETAATGGGADPMAFTHDWHRTIIERFVEHLDGGPPPLATAREALSAHAVIDAMERASLCGSMVEVAAT